MFWLVWAQLKCSLQGSKQKGESSQATVHPLWETCQRMLEVSSKLAVWEWGWRRWKMITWSLFLQRPKVVILLYGRRVKVKQLPGMVCPNPKPSQPAGPIALAHMPLAHCFWFLMTTLWELGSHECLWSQILPPLTYPFFQILGKLNSATTEHLRVLECQQPTFAYTRLPCST